MLGQKVQKGSSISEFHNILSRRKNKSQFIVEWIYKTDRRFIKLFVNWLDFSERKEVLQSNSRC